MKKFFRPIRNVIEYFLFIITTSILSLLSLERSSRICGKILVIIGPLTRTHKNVTNNIKHAYSEEIGSNNANEIAEMAWRNFGNIIGEFPHLHKLSRKELLQRTKFEGLENIEQFKKNQKPYILFSAHMANWEVINLLSDIFYHQTTTIYRKANNNLVNQIIQKWRSIPNSKFIPKGIENSREIITDIKNKRTLMMLVDQKMNNGIEAKFFGKPAMTSPAIARLALKYDYPIVPMQIIRSDGCNFTCKIMPALNVKDNQDIDEIIQIINNMIENWIRENPGQWFWFHNRWKNLI